MSLKSQIEHWDGKTVSEMQAAYQDYSGKIDFADTLFSLLETEPAQTGTTWLIKAWLEQGNCPDDQQVTAFYNSLKTLSHWNSRLHALQCLPHLSIPPKHRAILEIFLRATLTETNKFVRA